MLQSAFWCKSGHNAVGRWGSKCFLQRLSLLTPSQKYLPGNSPKAGRFITAVAQKTAIWPHLCKRSNRGNPLSQRFDHTTSHRRRRNRRKPCAQRVTESKRIGADIAIKHEKLLEKISGVAWWGWGRQFESDQQLHKNRLFVWKGRFYFAFCCILTE